MKTTTKPQPKPGYKKTPVGVIPENWEVKIFKGVVEPKGLIRGPFGSALKKEFFIKSGYKVYEQQNAIYKSIDRGNYFISKEKFLELNRFRVKSDDFIMSCSGTIGELYRIPEKHPEGVINQALLLIRLDKTVIDLVFFKNVFQTDLIKNKILETQGGAIKNLVGMKLLRKLPFPIPPLPEQKAIAACLSTWDRGIEKLNQLIAAKKYRKKGLMQQLLTGTLRLRSASGEKFDGEWKEVRLGSLGETFNGLTGKIKDDFGEGKPYVSYLNVFKNNKINKETSFDYVKINEGEKQRELIYGDLIFTTSSETPDEVGMSSVILFEPKESLFLNSFCFGLRLKDFDKLKPEFAVYVLRGIDFRKNMYRMAQGSTRFNLSKSGFKTIELKLPPLQEQTAIANILQTADKEIELLEQKLLAFQQQKKGLMQVLLTGEKRLV